MKRTDPSPPGPAAPPAGRRLGARDRLLDSARTLFYRRGVNNVGIDEVLSHSGVAKASLYKHFASKDALILAYMQQGDERWLTWLRERVEARSPAPEGRALAVFEALGEWFALPHFRGCLLTNVVSALPSPDHPAHAALSAHKARVLDYLGELTRQAGARVPGQAALDLLLLLEGATALARLGASPDPAAQAGRLARRVLEDARAAEPG